MECAEDRPGRHRWVARRWKASGSVIAVAEVFTARCVEDDQGIDELIGELARHAIRLKGRLHLTATVALPLTGLHEQTIKRLQVLDRLFADLSFSGARALGLGRDDLVDAERDRHARALAELRAGEVPEREKP